MHTPAKTMKGMVMVKLHKSAKEPEIYYYFNAKNEKLWMYRHKYYDNIGKRKEKKKVDLNPKSSSQISFRSESCNNTW